MTKPSIALLGLTIPRFTLDETVQYIFALIESYPTDRQARYIATVNTSFLVNTLSWNPLKPRHPELLHILRNAALVTPDGMPIVWLSSWLESPLNERVTGADLVPAIAIEASKRKLSIMMVGGSQETAHLAAAQLRKDNPGLEIKEVICPEITIEGEAIASSATEDSELIAAINQAAPDILLINLGHPKQEVWFERVHTRLQVPLSIGIGGVYAFISGKIQRAPQWMQKNGLEWLWRLCQEPKRLWRRYLLGMFQFMVIALPVTFLHRYNRFWSWLIGLDAKKKSTIETLLLFSPTETITRLTLPTCLSADVPNLLQLAETALQKGSLILDFRKTYHITLEGLSLLLQIQKLSRVLNEQLFIFGLKRRMRWLLAMHRVWDLFAPHILNSTASIMKHLRGQGQYPILFESIQTQKSFTIQTFFGPLDNHQDFLKLTQKLEEELDERDCIIDLTQCSGIENLGMAFLLNIRQRQLNHQHELYLVGVSKTLKQQMTVAKIDHLFSIVPDIESLILKGNGPTSTGGQS